MASDSLPFLPHEILVEILSKLPAKSLRFKCVSKFFCSLVVDHLFADLHRNWSLTLPSRMSILISYPLPGYINGNGYYTTNYSEEENQGELRANRLHYMDRNRYLFVSSSMNGLICFCGSDEDIAIHNLSTRQHISLPSPYPPRMNAFSVLKTFGVLGFDSVSRRYKVLKSVRAPRGYNRHWVFTLGVDKSWREIHSSLSYHPSGCRLNILLNSRTSVHIDGFIYSLNSFEGPDIVAFDVRAEDFQAIPPPCPAIKRVLGLVEVEGRLAVVSFTRDNYGMAIWILEESMVWKEILIPIPFPLKEEIKRRNSFFTTNHAGEFTMSVTVEKCVYILFYNFRRQSWRKFDICNLPVCHKLVPTAMYFILDNVNFLH